MTIRKPLIRRRDTLTAALAAVAALSAAGSAEPPAIDRTRYMPLSDIKPGMTGEGRTVLSGTQPEPFSIEVLSVVPDWGPKQSVILIRCTDPKVIKTNVAGGMSGSPIYLKDPATGKLRMIGALAYGWAFGKEPICGIQPIEQMLSIRAAARQDTASAPADASQPRSLERDAGNPYVRQETTGPPRGRFVRRRAAPGPASPGLRPLAIPLSVSGAPRRVVERLARRLEGTGLVPLQVGGAGEDADAPETLVPGGVLSVPLMLGDMTAEGIGTVTDVDGTAVLGFGHALFAQGRTELPIATGRVHTVVSSYYRAFKVGSTGRIVGSLVRDEETGIFGIVGDKPTLIPMTVSVESHLGRRRFDYRLAWHEFYTGMLAGSGLDAAVLSRSDLPELHTVRHDIRVVFEGLGEFTANNVSSMSGTDAAFYDLVGPMRMICDTEFGTVRVASIEASLTVEPVARLATMDSAWLVRDELAPGETAEVVIRWRKYRGPIVEGRYRVTLPDDLPEGPHQLVVADADSQLRFERDAQRYRYEAYEAADLMAAARRIASFRQDRLYLRLVLPDGGVSVRGMPLPELPAYREALLRDPTRRGPVHTFRMAKVEQVPLGFVFSGEQTFTLNVRKQAPK